LNETLLLLIQYEVEDENTNSLFSRSVLAMIFFYYNVNVQYNTSFKEEDMILPILNIICGSKKLRSFEFAPKSAEVP